MPWRWNRSFNEFRETDTGERVTSEDIEDLVDEIIDEESENVDDLIELFIEEEEPNVGAWKIVFADMILELYLILAALGIGGIARLTPVLTEIIEEKLTRQFLFLDSFAAEIEAGRLSIGSIRQRMRMYVNSSRQAYWLMRDELEIQSGSVQERWVTLGDTHVCSPCNDAEDEGWRPIGTFAQPGSGLVEISPSTMCVGLTSCRCRKEYR